MPVPEKIRAGRRDWYVLVRWLKNEERYEGFMLSGRQVREEVKLELKRQAKKAKQDHKRVTYFSALPLD
jgi:hypothetical protein